MKKITFILFVILVMSCTFASDFRALAMGDSTISLLDSSDTYFANPASLYFKETNYNLHYSNHYSDYFRPNKFFSEKNFLLQEPVTINDIQFIGENVSLSVVLQNDASPSDDSTRESFDFVNTTSVRFAIGNGYKNFGFGISGLASGQSERKQRPIRTKYTVTDYIAEGYLASYVNKENSLTYEVNASAIYKYSENSAITFGLYQALNETTTDIGNSIRNSLSLGYYFKESKFNKNNKLKILVFNSCIEAKHILSPEDFSANLGMEICFQLNSLMHIDLRGGIVSGPYTSITNFKEEAIATAGIGFTTDKFLINLTSEIPLENNENITANLSFGLNM